MWQNLWKFRKLWKPQSHVSASDQLYRACALSLNILILVLRHFIVNLFYHSRWKLEFKREGLTEEGLFLSIPNFYILIFLLWNEWCSKVSIGYFFRSLSHNRMMDFQDRLFEKLGKLKYLYVTRTHEVIQWFRILRDMPGAVYRLAPWTLNGEVWVRDILLSQCLHPGIGIGTNELSEKPNEKAWGQTVTST